MIDIGINDYLAFGLAVKHCFNSCCVASNACREACFDIWYRGTEACLQIYSIGYERVPDSMPVALCLVSIISWAAHSCENEHSSLLDEPEAAEAICTRSRSECQYIRFLL